MKSKVYFTEADKKMLSRLEQEFKSIFSSGDKIAIKLHMGEVYNPNHLQPEFVKKVVRLMTSMNMKPFLFDSPTMYSGPRHTPAGYKRQASELGFSQKNIGRPVVVSDEFIESKGKYMDYQVCRHLAEADGVVVLSHFRGHVNTGAGGAIKNLGMGALTKKSKGGIHEGGKPVYGKGCTLCKMCSEVCPQSCIKYDEETGRGGGRQVGPVFNYEKCHGCSKCVQHCPQRCLKPRIAYFDALLADGANAALKAFKKADASAEPNEPKETVSKMKAKVYFVNVLRRIANVCDCSSRGLHIVCPDIGILMGRDACAIDRASTDLVNKRMGKDIFLEIWRKPPLMHVEEAEKLGMGSSEYEIEDA